jgi:hypothetical protein
MWISGKKVLSLSFSEGTFQKKCAEFVTDENIVAEFELYRKFAKNLALQGGDG